MFTHSRTASQAKLTSNIDQRTSFPHMFKFNHFIIKNDCYYNITYHIEIFLLINNTSLLDLLFQAEKYI